MGVKARWLVWFGGLCLAACASVPGLAQTAPVGDWRDAPRGFVWEARKGAQRIVLVGTVHVGPGEWRGLPPAIERAARAAEVIAVEADASNAQGTLEAVQRHALYGAGEALLNERIGPQLRTRIEQVAPRYGLNPAVLWRMKPWFVALNISMAEIARSGFSPAQGTETQLFALATREGKRVVEIEGMVFQLKLFDGAMASQQTAFLEQTLESIESGQAQRDMQTLTRAWSAGDTAAMEQVLAEMRRKAGQSMADRYTLEQIIEGRHPRMLEAIEHYAASARPHLVAIGSLHYFGPKGLLSGLRERGWSVSEVR